MALTGVTGDFRFNPAERICLEKEKNKINGLAIEASDFLVCTTPIQQK